eukprot:9279285-Lingulodinium_polyedra.AAC.1
MKRMLYGQLHRRGGKAGGECQPSPVGVTPPGLETPEPGSGGQRAGGGSEPPGGGGKGQSKGK